MKGAAKIFFAGVCAIAVWACSFDEPRFESSLAVPNLTIGDMRAYIDGEETVVKEDVIITGRVVSSDRAGNFYNTFIIDDGTGAAEIMAGMSNLDAVYHPGQKITVRARGLAVGWRDGVMQLGLPPEQGSSFPTGYFYHSAVIVRYVSAERVITPVEPVETSIAELSVDMCGRLVRIKNVEVDALSTAETWASTKPEPASGYVKFRTRLLSNSPVPSDSITVVTSGYASFALAPVPRGKVVLTGILLYGRGGSSRDHFLLKPRDEKDIGF